MDECRDVLAQAIAQEDRQYWRRTEALADVAEDCTAGVLWANRIDVNDDGTLIIMHWSQEYAIGPRDYDEDCRERLDAIAHIAQGKIGGDCLYVESHIGEHAALLALYFYYPCP
jgi:hypothetical protein